MSIGKQLLAEFEQEMGVTRKVIERVPSDKGEWKPHAKSFSLAHLTQLVATMPGWYRGMLRDTKTDLAAGPGYSTQPTADLLEQFDRLVEEAREILENIDDKDFDVDWSLVNGEQTLFTMRRAGVVRMHMNHMVHHRAQLGVYLRLLNVAVPQMYGPTADEGWG